MKGVAQPQITETEDDFVDDLDDSSTVSELEDASEVIGIKAINRQKMELKRRVELKLEQLRLNRELGYPVGEWDW
jgi:hypothetical protein